MINKSTRLPQGSLPFEYISGGHKIIPPRSIASSVRKRSDAPHPCSALGIIFMTPAL